MVPRFLIIERVRTISRRPNETDGVQFVFFTSLVVPAQCDLLSCDSLPMHFNASAF